MGEKSFSELFTFDCILLVLSIAGNTLVGLYITLHLYIMFSLQSNKHCRMDGKFLLGIKWQQKICARRMKPFCMVVVKKTPSSLEILSFFVNSLMRCRLSNILHNFSFIHSVLSKNQRKTGKNLEFSLEAPGFQENI